MRNYKILLKENTPDNSFITTIKDGWITGFGDIVSVEDTIIDVIIDRVIINWDLDVEFRNEGIKNFNVDIKNIDLVVYWMIYLDEIENDLSAMERLKNIGGEIYDDYISGYYEIDVNNYDIENTLEYNISKFPFEIHPNEIEVDITNKKINLKF
ncbi:MAG: hypothetical protein M0R03_19225 [Novosphingobium sp.]|jgi:hypothetical protein|nr:hypothetical protein [Novosphingobium sp.]